MKIHYYEMHLRRPGAIELSGREHSCKRISSLFFFFSFNLFGYSIRLCVFSVNYASIFHLAPLFSSVINAQYSHIIYRSRKTSRRESFTPFFANFSRRFNDAARLASHVRGVRRIMKASYFFKRVTPRDFATHTP